MGRPFMVLTMAVLASVPAAAQSNRVYVSGNFAANAGSRGPVDVGTFPTAGGLIGVRLAGAWSIEFELVRGFGESSERIFEGLLISQVSGPGPHLRTPELDPLYAVRLAGTVWDDGINVLTEDLVIGNSRTLPR